MEKSNAQIAAEKLRAVDLAERIHTSFNRGQELIGESAKRGGAVMTNAVYTPMATEVMQRAYTQGVGQLVAMGAISPPKPPDPLEDAINDPDVSIYDVIRLAEERA